MSTSSERCKRYRKRILEISQRVTCHVAPAFSCLELVDVIYHDIKRPQDVFVLSKGHGCLAQYAVLEEMGVLPRAALEHFCKPTGRLGGHPDRGVGGIEASTGSLGHGLGMGVGMAYAEKLKGTDGRVYVLCSDGELQSGSTWEAVMMAARLGLDNLYLVVDANGYGGLERITTGERAWSKLREFGWEARRCDGHDAADIRAALDMHSDYPKALIARTVKGKGASFMVDSPIWHYRSLNS